MNRIAAEAGFFLAPLAIIVAAHCIVDVDSEPWYNNDETRHVLTGVFFRDAIADRPTNHAKQYAVKYYLQYPALGLMVWPPLFYAIEGGWMTVFGTSFLAAKALIGVFGVIAGFYFFRLVRRGNSPFLSATALCVFGLSPLVFEFSRQVMLELPCLAIVLASVFHFERYVDERRSRDAWLACLLAALAALTRFDGVFLLVFFVVRLLMSRNLGLLTRGAVIGGIALALVLTGPYYVFTMMEYGPTVAKTAQEGSSPNASTFFGLRNFIFYPCQIPEQIGWYATVAAAIGLFCSLGRDARRAAGPFFALLIATYAFFTPIAEMDSRHTIYWTPALSFFAVSGCAAITRLAMRRCDESDGAPSARLIPRPLLTSALTVFIVAGTAVAAIRKPQHYVFGYEEAAQYVLEHNRETPICLMDGFLNGAFIYYMRIHDPDRRLWTLRGDKVLYTVLCDPHAGYKEHAKGEQDVLALIHRYDPELIVVEEPQLYFTLDGATLLRDVLHNHPERFQLLKTFPIRSEYFRFANARLEVWRNLVRNPQRSENLEIEMLTIGRSLETNLKK